jgi:hypothetical protein
MPLIFAVDPWEVLISIKKWLILLRKISLYFPARAPMTVRLFSIITSFLVILFFIKEKSSTLERERI